ncbi:hypothetical protein GCM10007171_39100 [Dickeya fangzhongdai]|nr:hypothetical protein GCM10007171_39100 [Dickeya fangzhongdai]
MLGIFTKRTKNHKSASQNHHSKNKKQFVKMTTPPYEGNKFLNYPAVIKDTFPCQEKNYEKILAINRLFQAAVRFFRADRDDVADWRRFHLSTQRQ